jgi:hypothetical protein
MPPARRLSSCWMVIAPLRSSVCFRSRMGTIPLHFIDEPIEVVFSEPPMLAKTPPCPAGFFWRDEHYTVVELLEMWQEFERRGRFGHNMRPEHAVVAAKRGSWGVGRFYFRVRANEERIFEIYYDRAPKDAGDRLGKWFLKGERQASENSGG